MHRCIVCYERKKDFCVLNPCCHKVCFDCFNKWSNEKPLCPSCRNPFENAIHISESGEIEFVNSPIREIMPIVTVFPSNSSGSWESFLRNNWKAIAERTWNYLKKNGIHDETVFKMVLQTFTKYDKEKAKTEINSLLKREAFKYIIIDCPTVSLIKVKKEDFQ